MHMQAYQLHRCVESVLVLERILGRGREVREEHSEHLRWLYPTQIPGSEAEVEVGTVHGMRGQMYVLFLLSHEVTNMSQSQSRHLPLPPSLRATLAADNDLPSSEIRSEALLQRVIFSNPESLPMTPRPSRRHQQQQQQQYGQFAVGGSGTALFGNQPPSNNTGNGYVGRMTARPPRFLDSTASMADSDDEDDMEDSSDEDAQFAVDDIMDNANAPNTGIGGGSRSGSGSGSASGSVMLGTAIANAALGTEGGMEVDVPMPATANTAMGSGRLSNRTSMSSLRGFTGGTSDDSGPTAQNKNMTAWRESPSSTSNRAQKRKGEHRSIRIGLALIL
jgi:hypothetical protein